MPSVDLTQLRVGSRVKLRGPSKEEGIPRKPYPLGWRKVQYTDGDVERATRNIVVVSDDRWIPVALVTEIKNGA